MEGLLKCIIYTNTVSPKLKERIPVIAPSHQHPVVAALAVHPTPRVRLPTIFYLSCTSGVFKLDEEWATASATESASPRGRWKPLEMQMIFCQTFIKQFLTGYIAGEITKSRGTVSLRHDQFSSSVNRRSFKWFINIILIIFLTL